MAPSHGSNADFYGNGYVLSDYLNSATFSGEREASESTTFKKKSKTYIPGLKDSSMSAEGIFDGDIDAVDQVLQAAIESAVDGIFSYFAEGQEVAGRPAFTIAAIESSYEMTTDIGDVAQISAEFSAGSSGLITRGKVARPMAVAASGGQSPSLDFGAVGVSTTRGGMVVHATASNNLVVKYQHSTDNVTFTDIAGASLTFAAGRGSQRLVLPQQTINRYTRVLWTGTGTFMAILER